MVIFCDSNYKKLKRNYYLRRIFPTQPEKGEGGRRGKVRVFKP